MNVYDRAHELARSISRSDEYQNYQKAKEKVLANEQAKNMLKDYRQKEIELRQAVLAGQKPDEGKVNQLQAMSELLSHHGTIKEFLEAEFRLMRLMMDVEKIIAQAVDFHEDWLK